MKRLRLIRHPKTAWDSPTDIPKERYQGHRDVRLDAEGKAEAKVVRDKVTAGCQIDSVYSSDLSRALTVGRLIAEECGVLLTPMYALRGWNIGDDLTGQTVEDAADQIDYFVHQGRNVTPPGGESFQRFLERFLGGLEVILSTPAQHETVAMTHQRNLEVTHAWLELGRPRAEAFPSDYYEGEPMPLSAMLTVEQEEGSAGAWRTAGVIALGQAPIPEGIAW